MRKQALCGQQNISVFSFFTLASFHSINKRKYEDGEKVKLRVLLYAVTALLYFSLKIPIVKWKIFFDSDTHSNFLVVSMTRNMSNKCVLDRFEYTIKRSSPVSTYSSCLNMKWKNYCNFNQNELLGCFNQGIHYGSASASAPGSCIYVCINTFVMSKNFSFIKVSELFVDSVFNCYKLSLMYV